VFPHNIGLGATRDPGLVKRIVHVTAEETRATGPQWIFAPCVCVARDLRWARTYESYGQDPGLVIKMETAIDGIQGPHARELDEPDRALATAKALRRRHRVRHRLRRLPHRPGHHRPWSMRASAPCPA
jgi:beta-glucosidase